MSAVPTNKKRARQSASKAFARHSGEGRNPVPLISAVVREGSSGTKLPPGWKLTTLGAEFRWGSGGTPKSSNPVFYDGGIPWAIIGDLNDGPIASTARTISEAGLKNSSAKLVEPGSVLVAMYGSIGKLGIATVPLATNQAIAFTKPECCSAKFLFWYLYFARPQLIKLGKGGTQSNISQTVLKAFPFVLPPREEQQRIVAEIEKQFTRLDAGVAALRRVQANLKRYRAAVLKAACEGRLVPTDAELAKAEGRTYETGEQLLARILADRRKNWHGRGKYKEPAAPNTTNLPPLPEGWCIASADQLCGHITSGSRDWSQFYGRGTGTFVLAQNVRPMRLDLTERQAVDAPKGDAETERTRVQRDDILVTIVGAKTGDVCRIPTDLHEHFVCQSVALLRPLIPDSAKFIEMYLASPENGQEQWKQYIYGQGRPHLSFEQLRMTAIQLPPIAEQIRIAAEVERRLSVIDEMETAVTANLQRATRLRQSILQRAFSPSGTSASQA